MFEKIINFEERDYADEDMFQFRNVTFLVRFGPVKVGEHFPIVTFNLIKAVCSCWVTATDKAYEFPFSLAA